MCWLVGWVPGVSVGLCRKKKKQSSKSVIKQHHENTSHQICTCAPRLRAILQETRFFHCTTKALPRQKKSFDKIVGSKCRDVCHSSSRSVDFRRTCGSESELKAASSSDGVRLPSPTRSSRSRLLSCWVPSHVAEHANGPSEPHLILVSVTIRGNWSKLILPSCRPPKKECSCKYTTEKHQRTRSSGVRGIPQGMRFSAGK